MSDSRNIRPPQQEIDTKDAVSDSVVTAEPIETVSSIWERVSAAMKQDLGEAVWQAWIKNLSPVAYLKKPLFFRQVIPLFVTVYSPNMQKNFALC